MYSIGAITDAIKCMFNLATIILYYSLNHLLQVHAVSMVLSSLES